MIQISNSQANVFLNCEQAWAYGYIERLAPLERKQKHFERGLLVHELTAIQDQYMQTGVPAGDPVIWEKIVSYTTENWFTLPDLEALQLYNEVLQAVKRYVLEFSPIVDKTVRVEDIEEYFEYEFKTPKGRDVFVNGYIDRSHITENRKRCILDRKSSSTGRMWGDKQLALDPQLSLYAIVYKLKHNKKVDFVAIDNINTYPYKNYSTEPLTKLFSRVNVSRSEKELTFALDNYAAIADRMLDLQESGGPFIRNLSKDCSGCQFFTLCEFEAKGIDSSLLRSTKYKKKDDVTRPEQPQQTERVTVEGT